MIQIKLSANDGAALRTATEALARSGEEENKHKKARDAAKKIIERELKERRSISLEELAAKEIVVVQVDGVDVLQIARKESSRLDGAALGAAHPDLVTQFTKPTVASYFSSLLK